MSQGDGEGTRHETHLKILVIVESVETVLVFGVNEPQVLVSVRQNIQDEGRRVLQVHLGLLALLYHFVHELPSFL